MLATKKVTVLERPGRLLATKAPVLNMLKGEEWLSTTQQEQQYNIGLLVAKEDIYVCHRIIYDYILEHLEGLRCSGAVWQGACNNEQHC